MTKIDTNKKIELFLQKKKNKAWKNLILSMKSQNYICLVFVVLDSLYYSLKIYYSTSSYLEDVKE